MEPQASSGMPTLQPSSGSGKKIGIIAAIIVVLVVGGYFLLRSPGSDTNPGTSAGTNAITVEDQEPDTVAVLVKEFSCKVACFVDIHADDAGKPGQIIATSKLYQPGAYTNQTVIVVMTPGKTYHAMLHGDDGNGVFTTKEADPPLLDDSGTVANAMFKVKLTSDNGDDKG